jgi:death-on-curing protein
MHRFLPEAIVLAIHEDQIRLYGGGYGVRDAAGLDSALHTPQAQFDGQFLHSTIFEIAAAYGFHLCQNHPFVDGNKRTSGMAMFTFLQLNGLEPVASEADYYASMMAVASGQMSKEQLAAWVQTVVRGSPPDVTTK